MTMNNYNVYPFTENTPALIPVFEGEVELIRWMLVLPVVSQGL